MLETLETKLKDKSWTDTQEPEFIKATENLTSAVHNLAMRTYVMAELIDKFYEAVVELFNEEESTATTIPEHGNVYPPTQTAEEPA